jgi:hypothetical protein
MEDVPSTQVVGDDTETARFVELGDHTSVQVARTSHLHIPVISVGLPCISADPDQTAR